MPAAFRYALVVTLLALSVLAVPAQRLAQGSKPESAQVEGYHEAYCSKLTGKFRLCRGRTSEEGDADFIVLKDAVSVNRMAAPAWATAHISPDGFVAYRGDLDRDGSQEIVLVSLENVSNGMGVTYSTAYIFDGRTVETLTTPLSFSLQEFADRESFVFDPAARRTEILVTYWNSYDSIEPKRMMGVYLVGKWFRYRAGKLEPVLEKPTLARRFLNSFAAERDNGWFENRRPHTWLKDRRTHRLYREPDELTKPTAVEIGTIKSFSPSDKAGIQFETGSGEVLNGVFGSAEPDGSGRKPLQISSIGLWEKRYVYPMSYSMSFDPTVYFEQFEGRRVRIETYRTGYGDEFSKVWLLDE